MFHTCVRQTELAELSSEGMKELGLRWGAWRSGYPHREPRTFWLRGVLKTIDRGRRERWNHPILAI